MVWCVNLEIEEKHELMEHVAHQVISLQFMLELSKQLDVSRAMGVFLLVCCLCICVCLVGVCVSGGWVFGVCVLGVRVCVECVCLVGVYVCLVGVYVCLVGV